VVDNLHEEDEFVARRIVWILVNTGGSASYEGLLEAIDSPSAAVRRDVADALAWAGHMDDLGDMIRGERDPEVGSHGVEALESLGTHSSVDTLVSLTSLEDKGTRSRVNVALQRLTGQAFSGSPAWSAWWEDNKEDFRAPGDSAATP
jgi:HEAT repeat protein